jgi:hypothetical protein
MKTNEIVRYIEKGKEYNFTGGATNKAFAGNFEHKGARATYVLYSLDSFDIDFTKEVKLKPDEKIFRFQTERTKLMNISPLIKVNIKKGLVYWGCENAPCFDTKGTKVLFLNLVQSNPVN